MANINLNNVAGYAGGIYVADTNSHTDGPWFCFKAQYADAVFSSLASNIDSHPSSFTLSTGDTLFGNFTQFTLSSGSVIAYKRPQS